MQRPFLFVAREPDETLRTFLPVVAELRRRGRDCLVLFYHSPGTWALERLVELAVPIMRVRLPSRGPAGEIFGALGLGPAAGELSQLWQARRQARRIVATVGPAVVVVIQDTLLLERFLVREANRHGRGTLVVQWAFTYPQAMYDVLNEFQRGRQRLPATSGAATLPEEPTSEPAPALSREETLARSKTQVLECVTGALKSSLFALAQRALGVRFDLVNSYGGGEARAFAVIGEAFKQQFLAQGVRKECLEVTGHPLHDLAFVQRAELTAERSSELKARYELPRQARVILYATQPVLWRQVVTREALVDNVLALGRAVAQLGPDFLLVLKLHPREALADYAPAVAGDLPIRLIKDAEIAELIASAEAFISSSSSTVLLAMMLDKPIVTINFNQVPHFDYYDAIGGTLHVKSPTAAAEALRLALFDPPTRERLASERAAVLTRFARFDGQATQRLADLVDQLAVEA